MRQTRTCRNGSSVCRRCVAAGSWSALSASTNLPSHICRNSRLDLVAGVSQFVFSLVAGVSQMGWQTNNQLNCDTGVNLKVDPCRRLDRGDGLDVPKMDRPPSLTESARPKTSHHSRSGRDDVTPESHQSWEMRVSLASPAAPVFRISTAGPNRRRTWVTRPTCWTLFSLGHPNNHDPHLNLPPPRNPRTTTLPLARVLKRVFGCVSSLRCGTPALPASQVLLTKGHV